MNCREARRWLPLYLDSELSPETTWTIARHLEGCLQCSERARREGEVESALSSLLRRVTPEDEAAWERSLGRAQVFSGRRAAIVAVSAAALGVVGGAFLVRRLTSAGPCDLTLEMTKSHEKRLAGLLAPDVVTEDPNDLSRFFASRLPFRAEVRSAGDGARVCGGRCCVLGDVACAFVMTDAGGVPASVFLFAANGLHEFPEATRLLRGGPLRERTVRFHVCAFDGGDRVVGAVSEINPEGLDLLARRIGGV